MYFKSHERGNKIMEAISSLVNNPAQTHNHGNPNVAKTAAEKTQHKSTTLASENIDKFDSNSMNVNRNFNSKADRAEWLNVQGYRGQSALAMKNAVVADYVKSLIGGQTGNFWSNILDSEFTPRPFALDAYKAAEATSEKYDDYWGVEAVAERIFTFAKSLAGDDDKMFETMKNAFLKGFSLAEGVVPGKKLHDISYQTKERVLEYFDEWEKDIAAKKA